ncbi:MULTISPECIES: flagellar basal body L-ring protein FlgH [Methylotenera]|uniref:flagellar basal body L-ring protein FlgH n=1 Tax=Methylotenera TaxID=359407 RepID=UPI00037B9C95|nr:MULTISPECIES: flagellar basal body L-ring protein FlgH [Methylotenera]
MNFLKIELNMLKHFLSNIGKMSANVTHYASKSPCDVLAGYRLIARFILGASVVAMCSCAVTPDTSVKQPMTAKAGYIPLEAKNGGIFNNAAYKPLFEDRRARAIGDIITIMITENTAASKQGSSSASKTGSIDASAGVFMGNVVPNSSFTAANSNKHEDKSALNSGNTFSGTLSVTVIDVLANGNLVVSGEKQIALDKGNEFVRFSGVVNPDYIKLGNVVPSSQVADAHIEYRTNSRIDAAQVASILTRFFLSFIPL